MKGLPTPEVTTDSPIVKVARISYGKESPLYRRPAAARENSFSNEATDYQRAVGKQLKSALHLNTSRVLDVGYGRNPDPVDAMIEGSEDKGTLVDCFIPDEELFDIQKKSPVTETDQNAFCPPKRVGNLHGRLEVFHGDFAQAQAASSAIKDQSYTTILFHGSLLPTGAHESVPSMTYPKYEKQEQEWRAKASRLTVQDLGPEEASPGKVLGELPTPEDFAGHELSLILQNAKDMLAQNGKLVITSSGYSLEQGVKSEDTLDEKIAFANIVHVLSQMGAKKMEFLGLRGREYLDLTNPKKILRIFPSAERMMELGRVNNLDKVVQVDSIQRDKNGNALHPSEEKRLKDVFSRAGLSRIDAIAVTF